MARKKSLNDRRLTRKEVADLIASGARPRTDLLPVFAQTNADGSTEQDFVYELPGDRFLFVFDPDGPAWNRLRGKGDIYPADYFHRWVRWKAKVKNPNDPGAWSSTEHWFHFSALKHELFFRAEELIGELAKAMHCTLSALDFSYRSLDPVSAYIEGIGIGRGEAEYYDHLVAYVGEAVRRRTRGSWQVREGGSCHRTRAKIWYPFIEAEKHIPIMPINVVWEELSGLEPVNLRRAAANEVRHARAKFI